MKFLFRICVVLVTLLALGTSLPPQNHGNYPEQVRYYEQPPRHLNSSVYRSPSGLPIPGLSADRIQNVKTFPADVESFTIDGATIVNSPPGHGHPSVRKIFIPRPGGGEPIEYDLPAGDSRNITVIHLKGPKGLRKNGRSKGKAKRVPQRTNVNSGSIDQTGATSSANGNYAPSSTNIAKHAINPTKYTQITHRPYYNRAFAFASESNGGAIDSDDNNNKPVPHTYYPNSHNQSPKPVPNKSVSSKTTPNSYETTSNSYETTSNLYKANTNLYETTKNIYETTTNLYETTTNLYETSTNPDSSTLHNENQPDYSKHSPVKPKQIRYPYKNKLESLKWPPSHKPKPTPPGYHKPLLNRSGHDINDSPTNARKHVPEDSPFAKTTTLATSYTDSFSTSYTEHTTPGYPSSSDGNDLSQKEKEKTADNLDFPTTTLKSKDFYDEINDTTTHSTVAPTTSAPDFLTTLINLLRSTITPENHKRPDSSDMLTTKSMISTTEKYGSERSTTVNYTVDNNTDNENTTPSYPSSSVGNDLPHSTVAPTTSAPDFLTTLINLLKSTITPENHKRPDSSDMLTTKPMISTTEKYGSEKSTTVNYTVDNNTDNVNTTPGYPSSSDGNDLPQKEKEKIADNSDSPTTTLKSMDSSTDSTKPMISTTEKYGSERSTTVNYTVDNNTDNVNTTPGYPSSSDGNDLPQKEKEKTDDNSDSPTTTLKSKDSSTDSTKPMISTTEKYGSERSTTVNYTVDNNTDNVNTTPGYPSSSDGNDLPQKEKEKTADNSDSPTTTLKSKDSSTDSTKPMISTTEKYGSEKSTTVNYTVDNNKNSQDKTTSTPNKEQDDTVKNIVDTTTYKMIEDIVREENTTHYESKIEEDSKTYNKHEKTEIITKHEENKTVVKDGTKPRDEKTLTKDVNNPKIGHTIDTPADAVPAAQDAAKNNARNQNNPSNPPQVPKKEEGLGFFGFMFRLIVSAANQLSVKKV